MSWIHLDDLVKLILWSLTNEKVSGPLNATSPQPARNSELTKALAKPLSRPAFLPAPSFAIQLATGEMTSFLLSSQKVFPQKALDLGFKFKHEDIYKTFEAIWGEHPWSTRFVAEQWLPLPKEKVFEYFCDEKNLEELTPPTLGFQVLDKSTPDIQSGTLINYRLKIHGFPVRWRTLIEKWQPPVKFSDTQLKGPYKLWHHTHSFEDLHSGTLMRDIVYHQVPMGQIGRWVAGPFVSKDIDKIFDYRYQRVEDIFHR